jgi:hypothetical protein
MIIKESNFLNLNNELKNITHWCKDIVNLYTGDESFKEDISKFYNVLDDSEREDLFKRVEKISSTVHRMYLELDKIDEEMDEFGFL